MKYILIFLSIFVLSSNCSNESRTYLHSALETERWIRRASIKTATGKTWHPSPNDSTFNPSNLDFELAAKTDLTPVQDWRINGDSHEVLLDSLNFYQGKRSLMIETKKAEGYGWALQSISPGIAAGRRVRISGYIKTEEVAGGNAGLWANVSGGSGTLQYQELGQQGPSGTTPWERYEIEIPVPPNATQLNYGIILSGSGRSWFDELAVTADDGFDVEIPPGPPTVSHIYHGTAGVILFYLELFNSTGNKEFLEEAEAGANYLIETLPDSIPSHWEVGLYTGLAGVAFTLDATYQATQKKRYREHALLSIDWIEKAAASKGEGVEWGGITDIISGSAGIGLFLLYAGEEMEHRFATELATKAGERLLETSISDSNGIKWKMQPANNRLMPNFSHGTAGISYFLASLYEATNRKKFLKAALEGAKYLDAITNKDGLVFHHEPGGENLYYLGWCHGPAGTSRLYYKLAEITGDDKWVNKVHIAAATMMRCGIPEKQTPGFWNNVSRCCGSVAVAEFYLNLYKRTNEKSYLSFSKQMTENLLSRATSSKGELKWIQAEHRIQPKLLAAQTGFMQGAAGIGVWLLHLDGFENGIIPTVVLPDSRF